ncbi:MAG TPA: hypothetical protein VFD39_07450, partial [Trueperaceae bacterium]|nr:hypothetical protein [Trueperaceae bacterium]
DEYRESVLELVERKKRGGKVEAAPPRRKKAPKDLTAALEKSLKTSAKDAERAEGRGEGRGARA